MNYRWTPPPAGIWLLTGKRQHGHPFPVIKQDALPFLLFTFSAAPPVLSHAEVNLPRLPANLFRRFRPAKSDLKNN